MKRVLHLAKGIALTVQAVTETFGILAVRGVGKTYTAAVMAEQMLKIGLHVVIVDPLGVWWGIRASSDGKHEGLPIVIFGGDHADVPLEANSGEMIADLIVTERISAVLDLSSFSNAEQVRFMVSFSERLYQKNRSPIHLFLDEADSFAPQKPMKGEERMLGAMEKIVRRGRARGLGVTLITQRSAVLNKNVLTQIGVLIALRTVAPQDRKAIELWVDAIQGMPEQKKEMMESLASLGIGEAWFWSPGWLNIFKRVKVNRRETFDSSATPKVGARVREPKRLAKVDLERIKGKIASTIERAKQDDPRELRRENTKLKQKIEELTRELKMRHTTISHDPLPLKIKKVFVPAVKKRTLNALRKAADQIADGAGEFMKGVTSLSEIASQIRAGIKDLEHLNEKPMKVTEISSPPPPSPAIKRHVEVANMAGPVETVDSEEKLVAGERRMIEILSRLGSYSPTRTQLATLAGLSPGGGTTRNYFGKIKQLGFIEEKGDLVVLVKMPRGLAEFKPLNSDEVVSMWKGKLIAGARRMLDVLLRLDGKSISLDALGAEAEVKYPSGSYRNYLGDLRRNGLAEMDGRDKIRISGTLFLGTKG